MMKGEREKEEERLTWETLREMQSGRGKGGARARWGEGERGKMEV